MSKKYPFKIANDQFGTIYCRDAESLAEALKSIKRLLLERIPPSRNSTELRKEEWQALDKEIVAKVDLSRLRPFVENEARRDNATVPAAARLLNPTALLQEFRQFIEALKASGIIRLINYLQIQGYGRFISFDEIRSAIFINNVPLMIHHMRKNMVKLGLTISVYDVFDVDEEPCDVMRLTPRFLDFMNHEYPDGIE